MQNCIMTGRDQSNPGGPGAIHVAAHFGFTRIVEILLCNKSADIEVIVSAWSTPLHYAAANGFGDTMGL